MATRYLDGDDDHIENTSGIEDDDMVQAALAGQLECSPSRIPETELESNVSLKRTASREMKVSDSKRVHADSNIVCREDDDTISQLRDDSASIDAAAVRRVLLALNPDHRKWLVMDDLTIHEDGTIPLLPVLKKNQIGLVPILHTANAKWGLGIVHTPTHQYLIYDPCNNYETCKRWGQMMCAATDQLDEQAWQSTTLPCFNAISPGNTRDSGIHILVYAIHYMHERDLPVSIVYHLWRQFFCLVVCNSRVSTTTITIEHDAITPIATIPRALQSMSHPTRTFQRWMEDVNDRAEAVYHFQSLLRQCMAKNIQTVETDTRSQQSTRGLSCESPTTTGDSAASHFAGDHSRQARVLQQTIHLLETVLEIIRDESAVMKSNFRKWEQIQSNTEAIVRVRREQEDARRMQEDKVRTREDARRAREDLCRNIEDRAAAVMEQQLTSIREMIETLLQI